MWDCCGYLVGFFWGCHSVPGVACLMLAPGTTSVLLELPSMATSLVACIKQATPGTEWQNPGREKCRFIRAAGLHGAERGILVEFDDYQC